MIYIMVLPAHTLQAFTTAVQLALNPTAPPRDTLPSRKAGIQTPTQQVEGETQRATVAVNEKEPSNSGKTKGKAV